MQGPVTSESELRALEHSLATAMTRRDVPMLSRMFAPDYCFTSATGERWGRDRAMADFTNPDLTVRRIDIEVESVVSREGDYVVTGRSEVDGQIGDRSLSGAFHFEHVWRRSDDRWQLVAGRTWVAKIGGGPTQP